MFLSIAVKSILPFALTAPSAEITAENCLIIGDSLSTDIKGANNAGLPCCWFNSGGKVRPGNLRIDHEIADLLQLLDIV